MLACLATVAIEDAVTEIDKPTPVNASPVFLSQQFSQELEYICQISIPSVGDVFGINHPHQQGFKVTNLYFFPMLAAVYSPFLLFVVKLPLMPVFLSY